MLITIWTNNKNRYK